MTAWEAIKAECVKGMTPRSVGYLRGINKGSDIFVALSTGGCLANKEADEADFNADTEVFYALTQRAFIESL